METKRRDEVETSKTSSETPVGWTRLKDRARRQRAAAASVVVVEVDSHESHMTGQITLKPMDLSEQNCANSGLHSSALSIRPLHVGVVVVVTVVVAVIVVTVLFVVPVTVVRELTCRHKGRVLFSTCARLRSAPIPC